MKTIPRKTGHHKKTRLLPLKIRETSPRTQNNFCRETNYIIFNL